ncbi:MAG: hypothetical protein Aurels2KO_17900 [Aureliella sp.]
MIHRLPMTLLLLVVFVSVGAGQDVVARSGSTAINWSALSHESRLSRETLIADKRITIRTHQKNSWSKLAEGTAYFYCKESGALLDGFPAKDRYRVMIFPTPQATKYSFEEVDSEGLLEQGIDVALLRRILRTNAPMGMSGPSTPFLLDVRFAAKRNPAKDAASPKPQ